MHATTASANAAANAFDLGPLLDDLLAGGRVPGVSLAVTNSTTLLYAGARGWADLGSRRPASAATPYLWFSLTKIATATAAMALADRGRLDLEAHITDYIPAYPLRKGAPQPLVRQLLDHTAGLPNPLPVRWIRPAASSAPEPTTFLMRLLARHGTVKHPIGGPARYSNLGYLVLAEVMTAATGEPFVDVMNDIVLTPAGMTHTGFTHRPEPPTATGYVRVRRPFGAALKAFLPAGTVGRRTGRQLAFEPFLVDGPGYGGLVGDVVDAVRLARLHLADGTIDGNVVLRPETARRMRTIASPGKPVDLGLGWYRKPKAATEPAHVEHIGAGGGFYNVMRIYPELDLGVVVMANTTAPYDYAALFERIIATRQHS